MLSEPEVNKTTVEQESCSIICALCYHSAPNDSAFTVHLSGCKGFQDADGIVYANGKIKYEVHLLLFGNARIVETDGLNIFRQWHYDDRTKVALAIAAWDLASFDEPRFDSAPRGFYKAIIDPRKITNIK